MATHWERGTAVERGASLDIEARGIVKEFGAFAALRGVDLDVSQGELVALLGPSGSGKTTLLRVIAGLETPDRGALHLAGRDAAGLSIQARGTGFVFQSYALFKHMNVFDNIAYGLSIRPSATRPPAAQIRTRVQHLLELVQLEGLERRFPAQLSGGQRQRVALARALAIEPRVLLLDEPFGALDAKVRKELRRWLRDIHQKTGQTTIFVTHDQDEALELAQRVAILNQGRIEQVGTPDDIYDRPASAFVAGFVGEAAMLEIDMQDGHATLGAQQFALPQARGRSGPARLFVRPNETSLAPPAPGHLTGTVAAIRRTAAGSRAEIVLGGVAAALEAEMDDSLSPRPGDLVGLRFSKAHMFAA